MRSASYLVQISIKSMLDNLQYCWFANPLLDAWYLGLAEVSDSSLVENWCQADPMIQIAQDCSLVLPSDTWVDGQDTNRPAIDMPICHIGAVSGVETSARSDCLIVIVETKADGDVENKVGLGEAEEAKGQEGCCLDVEEHLEGWELLVVDRKAMNP